MKMQQSVYSILSYCLSSILMTLTNKLVLSSFDFKMNFLFLAFQGIGCVILLEIFTFLGFTKHRSMNRKDALEWVKVTISLVLMIYSGSKAIQYLPIPVFTIFKNLTIILIAYLERGILVFTKAFYNGADITKNIFISFMLMVLSSLIAGYTDIMHGQVIRDGSVGAFVAYSWMVFNCLSTAALTLSMKSTMKKVSFKDYDTVYFNNLISIPMLLALSLLMEREQGAETYEKYFGVFAEEYVDEFRNLLFGIVISSICTFAISFSTAWCIRINGATTYSMVGALNKLPIAIFGMIFFDAVVNFASVSSVFVAFLAGTLYSYTKAFPAASILPIYRRAASEDVKI